MIAIAAHAQNEALRRVGHPACELQPCLDEAAVVGRGNCAGKAQRIVRKRDLTGRNAAHDPVGEKIPVRGGRGGEIFDLGGVGGGGEQRDGHGERGESFHLD